MRKTFGPKEVHAWKEEAVRALESKYVVVETAASEWYKEYVPEGGDWEGGSGFCIEAGLRPKLGDPSPMIERSYSYAPARYVLWDEGMGWQWLPGAEVYVSVCDEHGDHRNAEGEECLKTLGVRGEPGKHREKETEPTEE